MKFRYREAGETRERIKFAFLPVMFNKQWRWLEFYRVRERFWRDSDDWEGPSSGWEIIAIGGLRDAI